MRGLIKYLKLEQSQKVMLLVAKKTNVDKYASMKELTKEVKKKKFHLIETGDQIIVICNKGDVKIVV